MRNILRFKSSTTEVHKRRERSMFIVYNCNGVTKGSYCYVHERITSDGKGNLSWNDEFGKKIVIDARDIISIQRTIY